MLKKKHIKYSYFISSKTLFVSKQIICLQTQFFFSNELYLFISLGFNSLSRYGFFFEFTRLNFNTCNCITFGKIIKNCKIKKLQLKQGKLLFFYLY